jgi:allantoinase
MEETNTICESDNYADDLPYWVRVGERTRLIIPYALGTNDLNSSGAQAGPRARIF